MIRENYRLNKPGLTAKSLSEKIYIRILFSLSGKAYNNHSDINFSVISADMKNLITKITGIIDDKYNK